MSRRASIADRHPKVFALPTLEPLESKSNFPDNMACQRKTDRRPLVVAIAEPNAHVYLIQLVPSSHLRRSKKDAGFI